MKTGSSNSKPFIISFIIFIIIGIALYSLYSREHKKLLTIMEDQKVSLTDKITARDSVINEWISTFSEIEKNLAMIKEKEKIITISSNDVEFSKDQRERILE